MLQLCTCGKHLLQNAFCKRLLQMYAANVCCKCLLQMYAANVCCRCLKCSTSHLNRVNVSVSTSDSRPHIASARPLAKARALSFCPCATSTSIYRGFNMFFFKNQFNKQSCHKCLPVCAWPRVPVCRVYGTEHWEHYLCAAKSRPGNVGLHPTSPQYYVLHELKQ